MSNPKPAEQNAAAASTTDTTEKLHDVRHSLAHLLASAVLDMFPEAKLGVGPVIDTGFYYDFELPRPLIPEDLAILEDKMKALAKQNLPFERQPVSAQEAKDFFTAAKQPFKVELVEDIEKHGTTVFSEISGDVAEDKGPVEITLYKTGAFVDLCRGGHVNATREIDTRGFKLMSIAGAYWRGDAKRPQLQRIYGAAYLDKAALLAHLAMIEEAKKRDHKMLGKQLRLFTFSPLVGSGLPMYMPRGARIRTAILDYITKLKIENGFSFVWTPHLAKEDLYVKSGHLGKYDAMLPSIDADGEMLVMKPMNCPHHFQIYNAEPHSYRDLPYRIAENATDYRNEKSGELNGLLRVRSLTQDDTHHFVRHDQIASEIDMVLGLTRQVYETFGFEKFHVNISTWDPTKPEAYFGKAELWETATNGLIEAAKRWGVDYNVDPGEAAFYGPKIDIKVEDALGRHWQLTTVQLDYNHPENFDLTYTGEDGGAHKVAVLHTAILGSIDRFMGVIIEHFGGAFPLWMAPVQMKLLPINEKVLPYAEEVLSQLKAAGFVAELDARNESLGKKVREAELDKIPHMLVIGDKEAEDRTVTLRKLKQKEQETLSIADYIAKATKEVEERTR